MTTSNDLWRSCGCVNLLARLQRPTDRCSQTSPWAVCLACQPASLAAWLAGWLISQQPSSAYLLSSTSSLLFTVVFVLELHTAFLSNQLFHFLTPLSRSSGYYIRTLLGRSTKIIITITTVSSLCSRWYPPYW